MNTERKLEVGVKAFIRNSNNEFLVLLRNEPYVGEETPRWDVPGGRIQIGEPIRDALAREIKEETSLKLKNIQQILDVQDILRNPSKHTVRISFLAQCEGKVELDGNEHSEYQWISLNEMKRLYLDIFALPIVLLLTNNER